MSTVAQRIQLGPFFDQGALCGAATLEHYAAGTSTLKNIWSDAAMTTTLPNPLVSNANGVFDFFADGIYKFILKRADGAVLGTYDNWKIMDVTQTTLSQGGIVSTATTMALGDNTVAHWSGSTDVEVLSGTAFFYWAIADGNFNLIHSSSLLLPDSRNRKVLSGDTLFFIRESAGIYRLSGHTQKEGGWTGRQGTGVAATATLAVPTTGDFIDVSGGTTITAVASAAAGYRFRACFTGTGLNITHNGTSLISPWGYDYRTVPNEIIEFQSLGSGNWIFYSLNGPKEMVGTTIEWNTTILPAGFLWENGQTVLRADYPGLFARIGTTFGAGDGSTTFGLPDKQGRGTIMIDGAANRVTSSSAGGANADTLGGTGGEQTHTLVTSEMPSHTHTLAFQAVGTAAGGAAAGSYGNGANTGSTGGDGAHNNMAPWIAKNFCIRF